MASGKIFIHQSVVPRFLRLKEKLDGHIPIMNIWSNDKPSGIASLHKPSLYPELNVPADRSENGDWGSVARGIEHLLTSLNGVPEVRTSGHTEKDQGIAQDINSELQHISWAKAKLKPKPRWTDEAANRLLAGILNPPEGSLSSLRTFRLIQLQRLALDEHPGAGAALEESMRVLPDETKVAKDIFDRVLNEELQTAGGKARAASTLIRALGFDRNDFHLRQSKHIKGIWDDRSLTYFSELEELGKKFESLRPLPGSWLKFQLPFALPVLEGIYQCEGSIALVTHERVINPRAGWEPSEGMRIETMMNPSGLYAQSSVELWLPGELQIKSEMPPSDISYKNIYSYPEAIREAVLGLNRIILGLRFDTGRSDIPEVIPGDLNQVAFKQFNVSGKVTTSVPCANFEQVRVNTGSPRIENELSTTSNVLKPLSFPQELLESAKFHISAYNIRRAVLDFSGAFEAFISQNVTPQLLEIRENTRTQFLNRYGDKLSKAALEEISAIQMSDDDPKRFPSIFKQLRKYEKSKLEPVISKKYLRLIYPVMEYRNDAAHGRPIETNVLDDLVVAAEALDCLMMEWRDHGA